MDVSIVIPTLGNLQYVRRALASIKRQVGVSYEVLLVLDSGAKDKFQVLDDFLQSTDISAAKSFSFLVSNEIPGAAPTRNVGIRHSVGDFIAFLDDDDEFLELKLHTQVHLMRKSGADFSHTDYVRQRGAGVKRIKTSGPRTSRTAQNAAFGRCLIATPTVMVRGEKARSIDSFFPQSLSIRVMEDHQGWINFICLTNAQVLHVPIPLTRVNVNTDSSSGHLFQTRNAVTLKQSLLDKVELATNLGLRKSFRNAFSLSLQFAKVNTRIFLNKILILRLR